MPNVIDVNRLCMGCMSVRESAAGLCPVCGSGIADRPLEPHQLRPRSILNGKYLVGRALGEGGFGITYLGWDLNLDVRVAIKEYFPAGFVSRDSTITASGMVRPGTAEQDGPYTVGLERFLQEAKSIAKFAPLPGIVAIRDFFRENGTAYIVMEYINGITLKQHLANSGGRLRPNEAFELMRPILKSLAQIHTEGVIHRDISPDNIMLSNKGEVKLLDFGSARDFFSAEQRTYSVLLKPGYAPVEQYQSRGIQGPFTDVYALCATLYKMITGQTPPESLDRLEQDSLMAPSALGVQISSEAEGALMKGLAVKRQYRYQSVGALYEDLYGSTQRGSLPSRQSQEGENRAAGTIKQVARTTVSGERFFSRGGMASAASAGIEAPPPPQLNNTRWTSLLFPVASVFGLVLALVMTGRDGNCVALIPIFLADAAFHSVMLLQKKTPSPLARRIHAWLLLGALLTVTVMLRINL